MNRKNRFFQKIRTLTIPPIMAFIMLGILFLVRNETFGSLKNFLLAMIFLVAFPALAYPLQPLLPHFKDKGRSGQRHLAIWMSALGYMMGLAVSEVRCAPFALKRIYMIYLSSGLIMLFFNKILKIRASGHACGIIGPIICLFDSIGCISLAGLVLWAAACAASLKMKRHTWKEFLLGSMIPLLASLILQFTTEIF